jgi:hypothetical protein
VDEVALGQVFPNTSLSLANFNFMELSCSLIYHYRLIK